MSPLQYELDKAEKLVIARYKEYNDTILGLGYQGAVERLHRAISRYETLKSIKADTENNLKKSDISA